MQTPMIGSPRQQGREEAHDERVQLPQNPAVRGDGRGWRAGRGRHLSSRVPHASCSRRDTACAKQYTVSSPAGNYTMVTLLDVLTVLTDGAANGFV